MTVKVNSPDKHHGGKGRYRQRCMIVLKVISVNVEFNSEQDALFGFFTTRTQPLLKGAISVADTAL